MRFTDIKTLHELKPGDAVRSKTNPRTTYTVISNYGDRVTAVRVADITNAPEWEVLR